MGGAPTDFKIAVTMRKHIMKKITTILMILILTTSAYAADVDKQSSLPSDWAKEEIADAYNNKIISEAESINFKENITREDFCQLAITMIEAKTKLNIKDLLLSIGVYKNSVFTDTDDFYVSAANELGIVNGVGDKLFMPKNSITREEAAIMLTKTAKFLGLLKPDKSSIIFSDNDKIADWSIDSVNFITGCTDKLSGKNVMMGTEGNKFEPKGYYTTEQAIVTFNRLFGAVPESIYYPVCSGFAPKSYISPLIVTKKSISNTNVLYTGYVFGEEIELSVADINSDSASLEVNDVVHFALNGDGEIVGVKLIARLKDGYQVITNFDNPEIDTENWDKRYNATAYSMSVDNKSAPIKNGDNSLFSKEINGYAYVGKVYRLTDNNRYIEIILGTDFDKVTTASDKSKNYTAVDGGVKKSLIKKLRINNTLPVYIYNAKTKKISVSNLSKVETEVNTNDHKTGGNENDDSIYVYIYDGDTIFILIVDIDGDN